MNHDVALQIPRVLTFHISLWGFPYKMKVIENKPFGLWIFNKSLEKDAWLNSTLANLCSKRTMGDQKTIELKNALLK